MTSTNDYKRNAYLIKLLASSYTVSKRKVNEAFMGYYDGSIRELRDALFITSHIDEVILTLDKDSRLIAEKEILEGLTGNWYTKFYSTSAYYRLRQRCYQTIIEALNR